MTEDAPTPMSPFDSAAVLTFVLLPLIVFLTNTAAWGQRALLIPYWITVVMGSCSDMEFELSLIRLVLTPAGMVIGALFALVEGPIPVLVLGAAGVAVGSMLTGFVPAELSVFTIGFSVLCHGLVLPAAIGLGANTFRPSRHSLLIALICALLLSTHLAGFAGPLVSGFLRQQAGYSAAFCALATGPALAFLAASGLGLARRALDHGAKRFRPAAPLRASAALITLAVVALYALGFSGYNLVAEDIYDQLAMTGAAVEFTSYVTIGVLLVCSLLVLMASLAAHLLNARVPTLIIAGLGLVVLALGVVVYAVMPSSAPSALPLFIFSVGEALAYPVLVAATVRGWHWRLTTAVAAFLYLSMRIVAGLGVFVLMAGQIQSAYVTGFAIVLTFVCAALLLGLAIPVYRHHPTDP